MTKTSAHLLRARILKAKRLDTKCHQGGGYLESITYEQLTISSEATD